MNRILSFALCLCCLMGLCGTVRAAEVDCDAAYCFTAQDFSLSEEPLAGICITGLPGEQGAVMLDSRILRESWHTSV